MVVRGVGACAVDGVTPARVLRPTSAQRLAEALAESAAAGRTVIPIGGGRALAMGDPPSAYDLALETSGLDRVLESRPDDMTVTVEAGISLDALQGTLATHGQFLPLDPFNSPGHTIGGLLATGWSGPLRLRYGPARDHVLGLRVALPNGRLVRSGGSVVKNVSGYDLNKLHLGALGSMGVIVEATLRVFPRPQREATVTFTAGSMEAAFAAAREAMAQSAPPMALELLSPAAGGWRLFARLGGTPRSVDRARSDLGWEDGDPDFWESHSRVSGPAWARISVPRASVAAVARLLPENATWFAEPGVGMIHWLDAPDAASVTAVRAAAVAAGGSLVLLSARLDLKAAAGAWGPPPASLDLMRRLRDAFDPDRTISRGRYVA